MSKARNLAEFKAAIAPLSLTYCNIMMHHQQGNILYLYNGAVPCRDPPSTDHAGRRQQSGHRMARLPHARPSSPEDSIPRADMSKLQLHTFCHHVSCKGNPTNHFPA